MKLFEYYNISSLVGRATTQLVGIECEIEDVRDINGTVHAHWMVKEDGSLRNQGYEFVTQPIHINTAVTSFEKLHAELKVGANAFTERTSIHVHANCANLEMDVVQNIVQLYTLFEEVFFSMVDPNRRENIHCVPLTETNLNKLYNTDLPTMVGNWHKYTALNIKPLKSFGTIEFRHMHGHPDTDLFKRWLMTIELLIQMGRAVQVTPQFLMDKDAIVRCYNTLTQHNPTLQKTDPFTIIENSLLDLKLTHLG